LSGSAMVALARRSSNLTIPWVLPKDEAINNSRTVCGDYATSDGNLHGFSCRGAPSQNTMFRRGVHRCAWDKQSADFAGTLFDGSGIQQAFVSVGEP